MNTFTDTDLTVLEGLDEAWPCDPPEGEECEQSADWIVTVTVTECQCVFIKAKCTKHLRRTLSDQDKFGAWYCDKCNETRGFGTACEFRTITSIEAL